MSSRGAKRSPRLRRASVLGVIGLAAFVLVARAVELQVVDREFLQNQGEARHLRVVEIPAHRGMLTDRHGEPLAVSTPVYSAWLNPQVIGERPETLPRLARALDIDPAPLRARVNRHRERQFLYVRRHLRPSAAERLRALDLPGVGLRREYQRYYPMGEVAAHVVGFTNIDDAGQEALELAYDQRLSGEPGAKRVIQDRLGHMIEDIERLEPARPGRDIALSLDRRIQYLAYRELKAAVMRHGAQSGSAVVLDTRTGEVLAMVNQPSFNPNTRARPRGASQRNRAVTDVFEPGSTIKPFTIAAALRAGQYTPETMVDTAPGYFRVGGDTVRDVRDYGRIDVATVIQKSSNVGAAKIALALEPRTLWTTLRDVGFGRGTASGFPGEARGRLRHFSEWYPIGRATLAFGYGVSVTPLQLAQAYATLSDGILRHIAFERREQPVEGRRVLEPRVATQVRGMLEGVVTPAGTGHRADVAGYRVAGKTGTVRKVTAQGYAEDRYVAVFVGLAPASDPRLAMAVVVDEPQGDYYGGQVAAPVFSRVMSGALRLLDVPPDELPLAPARVAAGAGDGGAT